MDFAVGGVLSLMESEALAQLTDEELAGRFRDAGDVACFGELVRRHRARVLAACRRVFRNGDAEDIAQEAFLRASTKIHLFRGGSFLEIGRASCRERV